MIDLKRDVQEECTRFGEVKKVVIFDRHPEGVVSVKFADEPMALKCIAKMNGHKFAGRTVAATMWDGRTNYKIEETDAEREARAKKWEEDLDKE